MLVHHSEKDYKTAASAAAQNARGLMEQKLAMGHVKGQQILDALETQAIVSRVPRANQIRFETAAVKTGNIIDDQLRMTLGGGLNEQLRVHRNALTQMHDKIRSPAPDYLEYLCSTHRPALAADILNAHITTEGKDQKKGDWRRFMVRHVDLEARAFLSDSYKPLDSRPLFHAFADAAQQVGAVITDGNATDLRYNLKAFLPMVFEPVENEVMCFGVSITNGEFGNASMTLSFLFWRLWCTNYAMIEQGLKRVHLGETLPDGIIFSEQLQERSTKLLCDKMGETVNFLLGPEKVDQVLSTIRAADEKEVDWKTARTAVANLGFAKAEMSELEALFNQTDGDAIIAPPKRTLYKVAQLVAWKAKGAEGERKLDLEDAAGKIIAKEAARAQAA